MLKEVKRDFIQNGLVPAIFAGVVTEGLLRHICFERLRCGGGSCRSLPAATLLSCSATQLTHVALLDFTTTTTTAATGYPLTRRSQGDGGSRSIFNADEAVLPPALCSCPYFAGSKAALVVRPDRDEGIRSPRETPLLSDSDKRTD